MKYCVRNRYLLKAGELLGTFKSFQVTSTFANCTIENKKLEDNEIEKL